MMAVQQPLAQQFFQSALRNQSLAHAYILKGRDYTGMYQLALLLAQVLNCQTPNLQAELLTGIPCGTCTDCRWAQKNAHPAVLTISRLTYQVSDEGDDLTPEELEKLQKKSPATQIKVPQIERLLKQLSLSSPQQRVIIFTDVEELPASNPSRITPPFEWSNLECNEEKSFHIRPLERRLFNAASANRFLKTLEEPPPKTVFFFITETEEQLLETIVSRCQVIPCAMPAETSFALPEPHAAFILQLMEACRQQADVYAISSQFSQFFIQQEGLQITQALELLQQALREQFLNGQTEFETYRHQQHCIQESLQMLQAKTNEAQSLLHMFWQLSQPVMITR